MGLNGNNIERKIRQPNGRYYIDESKIIKQGYKFSDPSDINNVYIWTKLESGNVDVLKDYMLNNLKKFKMLTQQVVILNPINV
jgi:hypothetical protein